MCFNFLYNFVTNISQSKKNSATCITNVHRPSCTVPVIPPFMYSARYSYAISIKLEISLQIFEKHSNTKFMKIRQMAAQLFLADRQTDRQTDGRKDVQTRRRVVFRDFANQPKKCVLNERYSVLYICLFLCLLTYLFTYVFNNLWIYFIYLFT